MLSDETEIYHIESFWNSVQLWKWQKPICVHSHFLPNCKWFNVFSQIARDEGFKKDHGRISKPRHWTLSKRQPFVMISSVAMTSRDNPTSGILYLQFSKTISVFIWKHNFFVCLGSSIQYAKRRRLYILSFL